MIRSVLIACGLALALAAPASACTPDVRLLGFSDALDKTTFAGTNVGGLSALARQGGSAYTALVDNEGQTPARAYRLRIPPHGEPRIKDIVKLKRPDGTPYTGADFDGEGAVALRRRDLLASSETEPAIRRFDDDGRQVAELPVPARFRVQPAGEATRNQTFESLTLSPSGKTLLTAVEGPLAADAATTDGRARIRLVRYGPRLTPVAQHYYLADPGLGVVEMLALSDDDLLVLERGFQTGVGNTVRIYRTSIAGAADVTDRASLGDPALRPIYKRRLVDIGDCPPSGATNPSTQPNPLLDNYEAMALGPRGTLLLMSDDNFGAGQVTRILTLDAKLHDEPTLEARATLSSDAYQPGPISGAALGTTPINGVTPPFPGQPIPGFSAVLDAGRGRYDAMPDNGFGSKGNSADFLLRLYRIRPRWESGRIEVEDWISLRDPRRKLPFPIVNEDTSEQLLTGADFDLESVRRGRHGDLWFGEEFGPYVLHTDAQGRVLEAPVPLPGAKSAESPDLEPGEAPTLPSSRGFEGMAISPDGRTLYPTLEGPLFADPDQRRRWINEFDVRDRAYTGRRWAYRTDDPAWVIGDLTALDDHRLLAIERDNAEGPAAAVKKIYEVDLRRTDADGYLVKREVLDLLHIRDPHGITEPGGGFGLGDPFSFPLQSVESVLPLGGERLLILNDNNYPNSAGRVPGRPDDTEAIVVKAPALRP